MSKSKVKAFPALETDAEMEAFVNGVDLSEYDFSGFREVNFEIQPKNQLSHYVHQNPCLDAIKIHARQKGVPYQRFMRSALEKAVAAAQ